MGFIIALRTLTMKQSMEEPGPKYGLNHSSQDIDNETEHGRTRSMKQSMEEPDLTDAQSISTSVQSDVHNIIHLSILKLFRHA